MHAAMCSARAHHFLGRLSRGFLQRRTQTNGEA